MTIKRTKKYIAAATIASLRKMVIAEHRSADELYAELEKSHHWDSKQGVWVKNPEIDRLREVDRSLVRVRVSAHLLEIEQTSERIISALSSKGFVVQDVSHIYPNHRNADGAGRVYLSVFYE